MRLLHQQSRILFLLLIFLISPSLSAEPGSLRIATTTSLENSGILNTIIPLFEEKCAVKVEVVARGTGAALRLAAAGDCDLVLVHAPLAEEEFIERGLGVERTLVMYNYFLIVGPRDDPAKIRGRSSPKEIFSRIAKSEAVFISRGDNSGTHKKELIFWEEAGIVPEGKWYRPAGASMAATLRVASEFEAYTLTDIATYLALKKRLNLIILTENSPDFYNPYSAIIVNPERHPHTNYSDAKKFVDFLRDADTQAAIAAFGKKEFGKSLFYCESIDE